MKTPTKISPDCLKDTIVDIRLMFNIPRALVSGVVSSVLFPMGFTYTMFPAQNSPDANTPLGTNQQVALGIGGNGSGFFTRGNVRIQFLETQIIFNCIEDRYVGWSDYSQTIIEVIGKLVEKDIIKSFNRISIRYISEFKNIEILKKIKGEINIHDSGLKLDNAILRLIDEAENMKTFITLTNKTTRKSPQTNQIIEASVVDINVFANLESSSSIDVLTDKLNQVHTKQKETFFGLMDDEFIKTFNPEY